MILKKPLFFVTILRVLLLVTVVVVLYFLISSHNDRGAIPALISVGVENTSHDNFVKKIIKDANFKRTTRVTIFLGPYEKLVGIDGFLLHEYEDYYIFIDWGFYFSLEQGEREALIAHELGHIIYRPNLAEQLQLDTTDQLRRYSYFRKLFSKNSSFRDRYDQIKTRYQVRADYFAAKKTSPEKVISLLNRLFTNRDGNDYQTRIENLNKMKQGQAQ